MKFGWIFINLIMKPKKKKLENFSKILNLLMYNPIINTPDNSIWKSKELTLKHYYNYLLKNWKGKFTTGDCHIDNSKLKRSRDKIIIITEIIILLTKSKDRTSHIKEEIDNKMISWFRGLNYLLLYLLSKILL